MGEATPRDFPAVWCLTAIALCIASYKPHDGGVQPGGMTKLGIAVAAWPCDDVKKLGLPKSAVSLKIKP